MTYNRHTKLNYCDNCEMSSKDIGLLDYRKFAQGKKYGPTFHLCIKCILADYFWCLTCQQIHNATQGCEQTTWLNTLFAQDKKSPTG